MSKYEELKAKLAELQKQSGQLKNTINMANSNRTHIIDQMGSIEKQMREERDFMAKAKERGYVPSVEPMSEAELDRIWGWHGGHPNSLDMSTMSKDNFVRAARTIEARGVVKPQYTFKFTKGGKPAGEYSVPEGMSIMGNVIPVELPTDEPVKRATDKEIVDISGNSPVALWLIKSIWRDCEDFHFGGKK